MSRRVIRWQDDGLWPAVAAHIPEGHHVVTSRREADARFERYLAESAATRISRLHFATLWTAGMNFGYRPNGMVVFSSTGMAAHLGFGSNTVGRDFALWVRDNDLWFHVPGKLMNGAPDVPGGRHRAYLVLGGQCDHCATPRRLQRS